MQDVHQEYGLVDIDIEHFKLFNDWYGIQEGDHLLMYISYQIRKKVQELNGIATRIGGDEFVMLLPQAACDVKKAGARDHRLDTELRCFHQISSPR